MTSPRILIVGSGPVGATYARLILDGHPTATVSMVEVGPTITDRPGLNVRNLADRDEQVAARLGSQGPNSSGVLAAGNVPGGAPAVEGTFTARQGTHLIDDGGPHSGHAAGMPAAAVSTNVGGQGAHWTCACPAPVDDERIAFIDQPEWQALVEAAETLLRVKHDAFDSPITRVLTVRLTDLFGAFLPEDRPITSMPMAVDIAPGGTLVWTGTDTVLGSAIEPGSPDASRFTLRTRTQARRIHLDAGRVTGATLRDLSTGIDSFESADVVVVAADAIRTPQLLFASGIRHAALGRYLTEHPVSLSTVALRDDVIESAFPDGPPDEGGFTTAAGDAVSAAIRIPYVEHGFPYGVQVMHVATSPIPLAPDHPAANRRFGYLNIGFGVRKHPRVEDGITFSESETDPFDMPNVTIAYELTEREQADLRSGRAHQEAAIAALGEPIPGGEPRIAPAGSSLHYMGTVRMGESDDGTSVVDPYSRVWGVEGLVLGGNGLIPTANVVNPTLTSVALAIRGASALLAGIGVGAH